MHVWCHGSWVHLPYSAVCIYSNAVSQNVDVFIDKAHALYLWCIPVLKILLDHAGTIHLHILLYRALHRVHNISCQNELQLYWYIPLITWASICMYTKGKAWPRLVYLATPTFWPWRCATCHLAFRGNAGNIIGSAPCRVLGHHPGELLIVNAAHCQAGRGP